MSTKFNSINFLLQFENLYFNKLNAEKSGRITSANFFMAKANLLVMKVANMLARFEIEWCPNGFLLVYPQFRDTFKEAQAPIPSQKVVPISRKIRSGSFDMNLNNPLSASSVVSVKYDPTVLEPLEDLYEEDECIFTGLKFDSCKCGIHSRL